MFRFFLLLEHPFPLVFLQLDSVKFPKNSIHSPHLCARTQHRRHLLAIHRQRRSLETQSSLQIILTLCPNVHSLSCVTCECSGTE